MDFSNLLIYITTKLFKKLFQKLVIRKVWLGRKLIVRTGEPYQMDAFLEYESEYADMHGISDVSSILNARTVSFLTFT